MGNSPKNNYLHKLTLIFVGMMAYIFADIIHEAIGHGLTSLILGNKITLLTSVYFRSEKHSFITDACGPLLNLAAGLLVLVFLKRVNIADLYVRLLLVLTAAFNFFWFSWMCIYSGFTNKGDFAFYISSPIGVYVWQFFLIISGFLSYYLTFNSIIKRTGFQSVSTIIDSDRLFLIPYLAAGIFSFIAVSFYLPWSFNNFYEAFVFPMFLPTVFLSIQPKNSIPIEKNYTFEQQKILILAGIILLIVFCLTMGIGIRP